MMRLKKIEQSVTKLFEQGIIKQLKKEQLLVTAE